LENKDTEAITIRISLPDWNSINYNSLMMALKLFAFVILFSAEITRALLINPLDKCQNSLAIFARVAIKNLAMIIFFDLPAHFQELSIISQLGYLLKMPCRY